MFLYASYYNMPLITIQPNNVMYIYDYSIELKKKNYKTVPRKCI